MGIMRSLATEQFLLISCLSVGLISSDTIVILGGEVDNLLHPNTASIQTFGPCGVFQSDLPDLPEPRREFAAALHNDSLVVCGGYSFLQPLKDCVSLTLGVWPLEWKTFPSMVHGRDRHGLLSVGGHLYAVGGSRSIGSERSIEMFDGTEWQEVAETNGFRSDFCALPWQEDGILLIGGYDNGGGQRRTELFNVTTMKWSQLDPMPIGRGLHSCGLYQGGMIAAGGWTETQDGWNEISHTAVWYDPTSASWVQIENLKKGRTQFALETVNGTMTAIGGFDGIYTESIEQLGPDGGWEYLGTGLGVEKAAFGVVKLPDGYLDDPNCV